MKTKCALLQWSLTLVPGRVNVYTLQNSESLLYATADDTPDEGDVVVESTSRSWKISQGPQSVKGAPTYQYDFFPWVFLPLTERPSL